MEREVVRLEPWAQQYVNYILNLETMKIYTRINSCITVNDMMLYPRWCKIGSCRKLDRDVAYVTMTYTISTGIGNTRRSFSSQSHLGK